MKRETKIILLVVLLIISNVAQYRIIFKYLEMIGSWLPSLSAPGIVLLISIMFTMFSAWMAGKADENGHLGLFAFWIVCAAIFFP